LQHGVRAGTLHVLLEGGSFHDILGKKHTGQNTKTLVEGDAHYVLLPVVPHKAVAEVSKIGNLLERLVVVIQGWQSEATDGPKGA